MKKFKNNAVYLQIACLCSTRRGGGRSVRDADTCCNRGDMQGGLAPKVLGAVCELTQDRHAACARQVEVGEWPFSRSSRFGLLPRRRLWKANRGVATPDVFFPNSTCLACGHPFPIR